ncbi:uncharacterized protein UV8b_02348 [Ustilaginoidea virens]|uniref:Polyketide synthase n=1 Tax=Ustilaginoidea virens TaxID=1159556 RepID=A0A8E5MFS1_USTVR|nr:uncharacterized protein UV8b_02348 [Ustilaginoidea virens]QUC18107.1 hypothetical protein UV8b_02348 [Ustilaginoidea virens]
MEDIAVIGIGLRFPGDATNPEELWRVLENGESQWRDIPKDRLNIDGYFHPSGNRLGSIPFRGAHLLKEDIAAFDAPFFSITADDAQAIDPQQRMLLEVSYEALENAGLRKEDIYGTDACVYVGSFVKDYEQICLRDPDWSPQYAATGNGIAIMANRISYYYNLHGPSMTVDTGCSGSLVSVHLAAQSLRNRESAVGIAAGAGMILTPSTMMPMTALNFLSPDGKCFTFDSRANGYGRGEGIGVVIMKRLSDAIRDNDTIRAVIRGTSVNQDGRTTGITLPSKEAQVANIRSVYGNAGLDFGQTAYVECHGTGTQAGDWRELKAISETLAAERPATNPVIVGSVKPNIGHLEGAAGVAGMIKGVLVLEKGKIPPNINFKSGNPTIDFEEWRVKVPLSVMDWPIPGLRRVSVNCFGFGGTNAHVILDEAAGYLGSRGLVANHHTHVCSSSSPAAAVSTTAATPTDTSQLFCYSASEKNGVIRTMKSHSKYILSLQNSPSTTLLRNYSYTLACRRSTLEWKGFFVARSPAEIAAKLEAAETLNLGRSLNKTEPKIAFVFSGQGTQWAQMGLDLMVFDAFRRSLEEANAYMQDLQSLFDLFRELSRPDSESIISFPYLSQFATTAIQVALVDLFHSFGVSPKYVIGHSSGEIAAAYAAGAISRPSAWEIAHFRGMAAISIGFRAPKLRGSMMAVRMSWQEMANYLASSSEAAEIACINSPQSVTISGRVEPIEAIAKDLGRRNIFHRILNVQTAYHSSHMRLVSHDYRDAINTVTAQELTPGVKMFSSVTGRAISGLELGCEYWVENLVSRVQYVAAMSEMMSLPTEQRPDVVLELSPRGSLRSPIAEIMESVLGESAHPPYYSAMQPKGDGVSRILSVIGELWVQGCSVDMLQVVTRGHNHANRPKCLSDLPPYPWNHTKSYWHESHLSVANRQRKHPREDLIGSLTADSISFEPRWRGFLRISENPWIQDHQVQKTIVYPAAGMISMVLEGAKQIRPQTSSFLGYEITDMKIAKAMIIPNTSHGLEVALNIKSNTQPGDNRHEFAIYSKPLNAPWEHHASGLVTFKHAGNSANASPNRVDDAEMKSLSSVYDRKVNPRQLYELLDTIGMNYGATFQNLFDVYQRDGACLFKVRVPDTKSKMPARFEYPHVIHPATLDSMLHSLFAIETKPMVPTYVRRIFVSAQVDHDGPRVYSGYATAGKVGLQDATAKIVMSAPDLPDAKVVLDGLHLTALSTAATDSVPFLPNYRNLCNEIIWKEDATFSTTTNVLQLLDLFAHKFPGLSVLQVGGSLSDALETLNLLAPDEHETPRLSRFTLLDHADSHVSSSLLSKLKSGRLELFVESRQKLAEVRSEYHLIISYGDNQLDSTGLKSRLRVGGLLLQTCLGTADAPSAAGSSGSANGNPLPNGSLKSPTDTMVYKRPAIPVAQPQIIVLTPEKPTEEMLAFISIAKSHPAVEGGKGQLFALTSREILQSSFLFEHSVVISFLDVAASPKQEDRHSILQWDEEHFDMLKTLQRSAKGIIWVTRGSHMYPRCPEGSAVIGLARVLMSEDPRKVIVTVDVDSATSLGDSAAADNVMHVFTKTFCEEADSAYVETEFAEKDGKLFIPRMRPIQPMNQIIEGREPSITKSRPFHKRASSGGDLEVELSILQPALTDDSWQFTEYVPTDVPGRGEVEIEFRHALLTWHDVETMLGRSVESTIGTDLRGIVTSVGQDVTEFSPGDEVTAFVADGCIRSSVRVRSCFVQPQREGFFPGLYASAYYAVVHMGRARAGKSLLIHGAASAHGLAGIEMARLLDVEVFATVSGKDVNEQRRLLESLGVPASSILDADDDQDFAQQVLAATGGKGVDVIYDTTQKTQVNANLKCIKCGGVLIQLANASPISSGHDVNLGTSSVSVVRFNLRQLARQDEDLVAELLESTTRLLAEREWACSPVGAAAANEFGVDALGDALRHVQTNPHRGLCTVSALPGETPVVRVVCSDTSRSLWEAIDPDGTYLLAGGLGGLGQSICELLIANGAQHIALVSRSGASSASSQAFLDSLRRRGVHAKAYRADICDAVLLEAVVGVEIAAEMPPVRGVFQCAAVVQDAMFDNMTFSSWQAAIRPKTAGSWNLVKAMPDGDDSPFFIFLASSAGVIGNRGQANYAAGNSYQDALAHHCRLQGKHAVSLDLGPVLGAGMLTQDEEVLDKLRASGFYGVRHQDFLKVVEHAITTEMGASRLATPAQVVLGVGTGGLLRQNKPADPYWSRAALYAYLNLVDMPPPDLDASAADAHGADLKSALARAPTAEAAADLVRSGLAHMLAKAMNLLPEEVDANQPPNSYGVDSLVAVGVRNWVLSNCAVEVSVFEVLSNDTISQMASTIAARRGGYGDSKGARDV